MKIKDLRPGMKNIDIEVEIDYIPKRKFRGNWGIVYVKDETRDVKMIFTKKELEKAKEGQKIRIKDGYVNTYRGELQLNPNKEKPIEFLD